MDKKDLENTRSLDDLSSLNNNNSKEDIDIDTTRENAIPADDKSIFDDNSDSIPTDEDFESISAYLHKNDTETSDIEDINSLELSDNELTSIPKEEDKVGSSKSKLSKKTKIIIACIVGGVLLIVLIVVIYLLLPKDKEEDKPQEPEIKITIDKGNYKYQDGTLLFLNNQDTQIGTYECTNKDENECYIAYLDNDTDDVNHIKNVYEDNTTVKFRSEIFHNRYVFLNDGDKNTIILYDILENKEVGTYRGIKYYEALGTDYAILKNKDNKYGLVKITSNDVATVIPFNYDNLISLEKKDNILIAKKNNKYYLIDLNEKVLTKTVNSSIYDYDSSHLVLKSGNTYSLVDYNNKEIFKDYNYISIINDNYAALVSDDYVYVRDYDNNKYNEVGFGLSNLNYSGLNTYNTDGVLKANSYAYKINVNNDTLTVFLKNNDSVSEEALDLRDGRASKEQKYYSSFNGILYFYSDEAKENVLGSYNCTNKNDFSSSDEFKTCRIALNYNFDNNFKNNGAGLSNNVLPIVNNRYVFLVDNMDGVNSETKLYDLSKKEVVATYKDVSANVTSNQLEFVDKLENVIVKNKSDKFGMINITSSGISKTYDFIYDSMERIGNYIEVARNNKYQILYSRESSSIELNSKIYDYSGKYFVVASQSGFDVYADDGTGSSKKVNTKSYKLIKLVGESAYIAVGDDYKVYVLLYDNTIISNVEIKLDSTDDIYALYKMVSASKVDNNIILNTFNTAGERVGNYNFVMKSSKDDIFEVIPVSPGNKKDDGDNETQE